MKGVLVIIWVLVLAVAFLTGVAKFKQVDAAMRIVVLYLGAQLVSEICLDIQLALKLYHARYLVINSYNLCEIYFITIYFLYAIKPYHQRKLMVINAVVWPMIWLLNIVLFQPITELNTNFLLLESFCTITLCLYFIYWLLRNSVVKNIFRYPHFWVAALWLLLWSVTFFFWVFVKTLYSDRWPYINFAMHFQAAVNIIVYAGIGLVLWFYPKKTGANETI
jgi:hypothetical protein